MRIRDSYANPGRSRRFAQLSRILPTSPSVKMRLQKHRKKSSIAFIKYFSKIIRQMKETNQGKFLIETDFLDTHSYFLPGNQTRV